MILADRPIAAGKSSMPMCVLEHRAYAQSMTLYNFLTLPGQAQAVILSIASGVAPISSKNIVPPQAASKRPV